MLWAINLCLYINLNGQETHIFFDAHTKKITYEHNGAVVPFAKIKKGEPFLFHLQNFNNFLYSAQIESTSEVRTASFQGNGNEVIPGGLLNGGISNLTGLINLSSNTKSNIEATQDISFESMGYGAQKSANAKLQYLKSSYDMALNDMYSAEKQMKYVIEDVNAYLEAKKINSIILDELKNLKINARLQPSQIKRLSKEYLSKVLSVDSNENIKLSEIIKKSDAKGEIKELLDKLNEEANKFAISKNSILDLGEDINLINDLGGEFISWKKSIKKVIDQSEKTELVIAENKTRLHKLYEDAQQLDLKTLIALRYEYESISVNDFSESFRFHADGDMMNIKIKLIPKSEKANTEVVELPTLSFPVSGGLKVNTSMGLSFGMFSKPPMRYFIKGSVVSSQPKDEFTPLITSFLIFIRKNWVPPSLADHLEWAFH